MSAAGPESDTEAQRTIEWGVNQARTDQFWGDISLGTMTSSSAYGTMSRGEHNRKAGTTTVVSLTNRYDNCATQKLWDHPYHPEPQLLPMNENSETEDVLEKENYTCLAV